MRNLNLFRAGVGIKRDRTRCSTIQQRRDHARPEVAGAGTGNSASADIVDIVTICNKMTVTINNEANRVISRQI